MNVREAYICIAISIYRASDRSWWL